MVTALVRAGADTKAHNPKGWTPLMAASWAGNTDVVKVLLDGGADVDAADEFGRRSLQGAAGNGNLEIVKLLLAKGANPERGRQGGVDGTVAGRVTGATRRWSTSCSTRMPPSTRANFGRAGRPLMAAAGEGDSEVVEKLLARGADINAKREDGWTALMIRGR